MTYIKQSILQTSERVVEANSDSGGQRPNLFKSVEGNFLMIYMEGLKENYIFIAALLQVMPCVGSGIRLDTEQWCLSNFCLFLYPSKKIMSWGLSSISGRKGEFRKASSETLLLSSAHLQVASFPAQMQCFQTSHLCCTSYF